MFINVEHKTLLNIRPNERFSQNWPIYKSLTLLIVFNIYELSKDFG